MYGQHASSSCLHGFVLNTPVYAAGPDAVLAIPTDHNMCTSGFEVQHPSLTIADEKRGHSNLRSDMYGRIQELPSVMVSRADARLHST